MELQEVLREVLKYPNTAAFSRIRYVRNIMSEEEQQRFLNGLFVRAVEARESGSANPLWGYLEEWEERGVAMAGERARAPEVGPPPWATLRVPISQAKFAVVTTGGFYVEGQEPYETDGPENLGDWSFREIPRDTLHEKLRIAHIHYDLSGPQEDPNCVFPQDRFIELEREGIIGGLADTNYSFMGYIQRPDLLSTETAPEVARRLKGNEVDAVLLTST